MLGLGFREVGFSSVRCFHFLQLFNDVVRFFGLGPTIRVLNLEFLEVGSLCDMIYLIHFL